MKPMTWVEFQEWLEHSNLSLSEKRTKYWRYLDDFFGWAR